MTWAGKNGLLKDFDWEKSAEVFEKINNWFVSFNSKVPLSYKYGEVPYGTDLGKQNKILDDASEVITTMKIGSHKKLVPLPYLKENFS